MSKKGDSALISTIGQTQILFGARLAALEVIIVFLSKKIGDDGLEALALLKKVQDQKYDEFLQYLESIDPGLAAAIDRRPFEQVPTEGK